MSAPEDAAPPPTVSGKTNSALAARAFDFVLMHAVVLSALLNVSSLTSESTLQALLSHNSWQSAARDQLLLTWLMVAAGCSALFAGATWRWGSPLVRRVVGISLPAIPLSFLPALLTTERWFSAPLDYLIILSGFGFLTQACVAQALAQWPRRGAERSGKRVRWLARLQPALSSLLRPVVPWLPLTTVVVGALLYTGYTGYLTVLNHHRWGTGAYDLGIFDNVMFNSLQGHPFRSTIMFGEGSKSFLLSHTPYLLYAFLPFYAIHPSAEAMLWLQAALLGSAAIVFFFFARLLIAQTYAAILALLFLLWAPMHGAQFYDFHWLTVAPVFHFFLFYALARGKGLLIAVATLLLWLLREDMAPGMALLGLILLLSGVRPRAGLFLALGSSVWFAINKFAIMPSFGTWWFANLYEPLTTPTEKGYGSVIKTLLTNPLFALPTLFSEGKFVYLLHLIVPLALVPIRRPKLALLLIPGALFTILTNAGANYSIRYQYSSHYAGYVFAAVVLFFHQLERERATHPTTSPFATLCGVVFCMVCHTTTYGVVIKPSSFIGGAFPITFSLSAEEKKNKAAFDRLAALIPRDATVTATTKDSPHLSNRLNIYAFSHSQHKSEYLFINPSSFGMGSTNQDILAALGGDDYGLVDKVEGMTLWKRGHSSPETKKELERLRRRLGHARRRR